MKSLLIVLFCLVSYLSYGQLQINEASKETVIGSIKTDGYRQIELSYKIHEGDTAYILLYQNEKYKTLSDFKTLVFFSRKGEVNDLYNILKTFFSSENKNNKEYKVDFTLGNDNISVLHLSSGLMVSGPDGYFTLREKELARLFGKI